MNQNLLEPTDVLFFRDGRPMGGSHAGNGAAWPLPSVTNAALHAALWRSGLADTTHAHARRSGLDRETFRKERFGSLTSAGPFPVQTEKGRQLWFFPTPADARCSFLKDIGANDVPLKLENIELGFAPISKQPGTYSSSPLPFQVASLHGPSKDQTPTWLSSEAWRLYLHPGEGVITDGVKAYRDLDIFDREAQIGIAINAESGVQYGKGFYSAHYLRLRETWCLGMFAATSEKFDEPELRGKRQDLLKALFQAKKALLVGGQQRTCTAQRIEIAAEKPLPLPLGWKQGFATAALPHLNGPQPKHLVKWVLLSPALYPALKADPTRHILAHGGGWLPSWVSDDKKHEVLLRPPLPPRDISKESRDAYRSRVRRLDKIVSSLVAALVPKPLPVTGWSLGDEQSEDSRRKAGPKPLQLAVPAGAVYYFACDTEAEARALASVLNWHGESPGTEIRNRRSTLLGEKGFGLGVCGTWTPLCNNTLIHGGPWRRQP